MKLFNNYLSGMKYAIDSTGGTASGNARGTGTGVVDVKRGGQSRGQDIQVIAYAKEVWSRAQQEVSRLSDAVTHKTQEGSYKLYAIAEKRNLQRAPEGVHATLAAEQRFERRALFTNTYEDAARATSEDLGNGQVSIFDHVREEQMKAYGRLKDQLILQTLIQDVKVSRADAEETDSPHRLVAGAYTLTAGSQKNNLIDQKQKLGYIPSYTAGSNRAAALTADDIENVAEEFASRDVVGKEIVCAVTPKVRSLLRKNGDFKNAEDVFSPMKGSVSNINDQFVYRNIRFIPISPDVEPPVSDTAMVSSKVPVKVLGVNATAEKDDLVQTTLTLSSDTGKVERTWVAGTTGLRAYFWCPEALYFADRPSEMKARHDVLPMAAYAEQVFLSVSMGALLIDSQHAMVLYLGGTLAAS